ncbi:hypothetical protein [Parvularcula oceani]|uniref:hypothetical protein n=1 Tax=Parvularcula oceani TaxID=1247963 RepID=UPI0004E1E979|nr:hypothetical protein [Parvularcula oceani]
MKTKLLLAAASTFAITACGAQEVDTETAELEPQDTQAIEQADPDESEGLSLSSVGDLENPSAYSEDELSGDDEEGYASADEMALEDDYDLAESTPEAGYGTGGVEYDDDDVDIEDIDLETADAELTTPYEDGETEMAAGDSQSMGADEPMQTAQSDASGQSSDEEPVSDGVSATQYTANQTDAYVGADDNLVTGSEAALLSGTYDATIMMADGTETTKTLYIQGEGDTAVGTFGGEPIEVAVTGRNFQFDAPVMMNGEDELMTFTGTFEDGQIDNGVVAAQGGDGSTMDWTAERTSDAVKVGEEDMLDENM